MQWSKRIFASNYSNRYIYAAQHETSCYHNYVGHDPPCEISHMMNKEKVPLSADITYVRKAYISYTTPKPHLVDI